MPAKSMDELVALCKRRGFIFQSSDIYGGLQGVYDYGPLGVELKNNLHFLNHTKSRGILLFQDLYIIHFLKGQI